MSSSNNDTGFPIGTAITAISSGAKLFNAISEDNKNSSTRNTAEAGANVASGLLGGLLGGWLGEYIGEQIKPGEDGKKYGQFIGSILGAYAGAAASDAVVTTVLDSNQYEMDEVVCESCYKRFYARVYKAEKLCADCK